MICPNCGNEMYPYSSDEIDWGLSDVVVFGEWVCGYCGAKFRVSTVYEFSHTEFEEIEEK